MKVYIYSSNGFNADLEYHWKKLLHIKTMRHRRGMRSSVNVIQRRNFILAVELNRSTQRQFIYQHEFECERHSSSSVIFILRHSYGRISCERKRLTQAPRRMAHSTAGLRGTSASCRIFINRFYCSDERLTKGQMAALMAYKTLYAKGLARQIPCVLNE